MNWLVIIGISVVAMILAMIWFGPLFGKLWMKIHGWSEKDMKKQQEGTGKLLVWEAVNTLIMVGVLAYLMMYTTLSALNLSLLIWIGFLYPLTVSGVIWGADKKEYWYQKIAILAGFNLVVLLIASFLLQTFS